MLSFEYVIKDPVGIHARPAGLVVSVCKEFTSKITIEKEGKNPVDAKRLFGIMGLGVKNGEKIKMTFDGEDEAKALEKVKEVLTSNL